MLTEVALASVPPQPWRNGGGSTQELLVWPSAEHWRVRVSVAEISQDGPFSAFPGIERWFAVVDGAGVTLTLPAATLALTAHSDPLRFDGALAPPCTLLDGPTHDLNLMVRTDSGMGHMRRALAGVPCGGVHSLRALYTATGVTLDAGTLGSVTLAPRTLAWSTAPGRDAWMLQPTDGRPPRAWWLTCTGLSLGV